MLGLVVAQHLHVSTVDRITFSNDTATASLRGPLSLTRRRIAASGNTTDAWFGGD
jgi:hypothetical protein